MTALKLAVGISLMLWLGGTAQARILLKDEPPMGKLKLGQVVYVDNGFCPAGEILKLTGGDHVKVGGTQRIERKRECVKR